MMKEELSANRPWPVAELTELACRAFEGLGLTRTDAADVVKVLVLADLFGLSTHGLSRIESYGERLLVQGIRARPTITVQSPAPALRLVDGDNGVGPLVGMHALRAALEEALLEALQARGASAGAGSGEALLEDSSLLASLEATQAEAASAAVASSPEFKVAHKRS